MSRIAVVIPNVQRWGAKCVTASGLVNVGADLISEGRELGVVSNDERALMVASPRGIAEDLLHAYPTEIEECDLECLGDQISDADLVIVPSLDVRSDGSEEYSVASLIALMDILNPSKTVVFNISRDASFYWNLTNDTNIDRSLRNRVGEFLWNCRMVVSHDPSLYDYRIARNHGSFGQILYYNSSRERFESRENDFSRSVTFQRPSRFKGFWNWVNDDAGHMMISNVKLNENEELRQLQNVSIVHEPMEIMSAGFFDEIGRRKLLIQSRYDMKSDWFQYALDHSDHYLMCHDYRYIDGAYGVIEYAQFEALYEGLPLMLSRFSMKSAIDMRLGRRAFAHDPVFKMILEARSLDEQRLLVSRMFSARAWLERLLTHAI